MKYVSLRRCLASTLAVLILAQGATSVAMAAEKNDSQPAAVYTETAENPANGTVELQNGTAVIPADSTADQVQELLFEALVANKEALGDTVDPQSLEWEYYCTGKKGLLTNDAWGSVYGFTSESKWGFITTTYNHPSLAANEDGTYQVRLAGTETEVTLTKTDKFPSQIVLNGGCTVALPYRDDLTVDYDALRTALFDAVVASTNPAGLTAEDLTFKYYATATTGSVGGLGKDWVPLEGNSTGLVKYPAISAGEQLLEISWPGNDTWEGNWPQVTVTITDREPAPYTLNDPIAPVTLQVKDDLTVDYDALRMAIFEAVVKESEVLTAENVTMTYYATANSGSVGDIGKAWMPLEGGKDTLTYPAISAGEQLIRISWPGNQQYAATTIETTVTVNDRDALQFNLNEGPYEVGMTFDADQGYDYAEIAQQIYNTVVASTSPIQIDPQEVTVEYNADPTGALDRYKPLDYDATPVVERAFGIGTYKIRISWPGNVEYKGNEVVVEVTTTDSRLASSVVLKDGISFTYNMDANVMKQAILDSCIDWENSVLPARDSLSLDDFVLEYYATAQTGSVGEIGKNWAPIEGGTVSLLQYPQMGAGEQQIRVTYIGGADYRPSDASVQTLIVNKARVKVNVHSDNIFADETTPSGFITTNPADTFDTYIVYAGVTSNVTTAIYLELPTRFTEGWLMTAIDEALKLLGQPTLTEMLNNGVTVGQLRDIFSTEGLLEALEKLNIDLGAIGQLLDVINKLPSVVDSLRISFGSPNRAGLYTVAAITANPNYETGVGVGFLLVKMRLSGAQLTWNQEIPGGKLTAEQAKDFDFGMTLSYNGVPTADQSSVHFLYSGITSKFRIYSSTTTPPTEPGSYIVTACVLGGNYLAAPITRTFQITK